MILAQQFPGLARAVKEMGYDNGCINRYNTEDEVIEYALSAVHELGLITEMTAADGFLNQLTDEQLNELTCGEADGIEHAPASLYGMTDRILNVPTR
jgi:hypothetical protein